MMKISIIGAGKAAWFLTDRLRQSGISIYQVYNRTIDRGQHFADHFQAEYIEDFRALDLDIDVLFFAISESQIAPLADQMNISTDTLNISLSGSLEINTLPLSKCWAVFWPIYSLVHGAEMKSDIPLVLNLPKEEGLIERAQILANAISNNQYLLDEKKRMVAHLAAVFANNFVNFLNKEMFTIMKEHEVDTAMILDIMESTLDQSIVKQNRTEITGPAARRDQNTMDQHMKILQNDPIIQKLYKNISQSIIEKTPY